MDTQTTLFPFGWPHDLLGGNWDLLWPLAGTTSKAFAQVLWARP